MISFDVPKKMRGKDKKLLKFCLYYLAPPLLLMLIPASAVERLPAVCIFQRFTGNPCPGCGMTRAVLSVMDFRLREAADFNRLVTVVFPLIFFLFLKQGLKELQNLRKDFQPEPR